MNLVLFDGKDRDELLPLVFHCSISDLRVGIDTLREKWENQWNGKVFCQVPDYLGGKYPALPDGEVVYVYAGVVPNPEFIQALMGLKLGARVYKDGKCIAAKLSGEFQDSESSDKSNKFEKELLVIRKPWDVFKMNDQVLKADFHRITMGRKSNPIPGSNTCIGEDIFLEEGAKVEASILNASSGPIYLGKNAEIMEGSMVRGGLALCESAVLKLGTKIYGATTIGPFSKVGGEVNNSVIRGYSNKGHDGFLGNSVLGEWCNLGADTNNSNLKNNYSSIKVYSYASNDYQNTGLQFCGLIMGDHSKTGINTMLNTGTVVGSNANIFGGGFPPKHIPSFSWGGADGMVPFNLDKAKEVATRMMERRGIQFDEHENHVFEYLFQETESDRN